FRELARFPVTEAWDVDDLTSGRERRRSGRELQLGFVLLDPDGGDEEERWRFRGPKNVTEEREAVGVGPLQVVDAEDERRAITHASEQLPERREDATPTLEWIDLGTRQRILCECFDA